MGYLVTKGAKLMCSAGSKSSALELLPHKGVKSNKKPIALITDSKPFVNIKPFGNCNIFASGKQETNQSCKPDTKLWIQKNGKLKAGGKPVINNSCKIKCAVGGIIKVIVPNQMNVKG